MGGILTIIFNDWHGLLPLSKIIYSCDDMMMPPSSIWVAIHEINPHFMKGLTMMIGCNGARCKCIFREKIPGKGDIS